MTIAELKERGNTALSRVPRDLLLVTIVVLASTTSFGLGILAGRDIGAGKAQNGFWIEDVAATSTLPATAVSASIQAPGKIPVVPAGTIVTPAAGKYLASKNGTKYYLPGCTGAKRIKEENKVWFATLAEAQASGRTAAANCPGL
jgi:hypothetical protein